jgi:glycosyltransferase involved in cell wall biosynthesis
VIHISKRILIINPHRLSAKYQKGGQVRTFALFKELTKKFEVLLLSIATYPKDGGKLWNVQNALKEKLVYEGFFHTLLRINAYLMGWPSDFIHILLRSPSLNRAVTSKIGDFDIICLEFPYLINYLKKEDGKLLCYNAHNVEYELMQKKYSNKHIIFKKFVLRKIYEAEKKSCEMCDIVLTTSQRDKDLMKKLYSIKNEKVYVIQNGVWTKDIKATNLNEKIKAKKQFNVRNAILFIGGSYDPNFEAVKYIYKWAEQAPKYDFLILGSSGSILKNMKPLDNLKILGSVDEEDIKKL